MGAVLRYTIQSTVPYEMFYYHWVIVKFFMSSLSHCARCYVSYWFAVQVHYNYRLAAFGREPQGQSSLKYPWPGISSRDSTSSYHQDKILGQEFPQKSLLRVTNDQDKFLDLSSSIFQKLLDTTAKIAVLGPFD
uniref:Uncharacterized protein n=1 Tax=Cacopsylla melanoneura TaxID=428564 RepID=A0A8D9E6T4_9HEMI